MRLKFALAGCCILLAGCASAAATDYHTTVPPLKQRSSLQRPSLQRPSLQRASQQATYHLCRGEHLSVHGWPGPLPITNLRVSGMPCFRAAAAVRASSYEATPAGPLLTSPGFSCNGPVGPPPPGASPRYYYCSHRRQLFEFLVPGFS